ncbi:MAG: hypothetical protein AAFU03_11565 [Bacteroidota bacterium]
MKNLLYAIISLSILFAAGCGDDDATVQDVLQHDGPNLTGPTLGQGLHELAARFTAAELAPYVGRELDKISFYLRQIPASVEVVVYGQGDLNTPGPDRYARDITNRITTTGWIEHRLTEAIDIRDEDIWISIAVLHDGPQQSVGCDTGPTQPGGDHLFLSTEPDWSTFSQLTGESVNWNIRAFLRPE